MSPTFATRPSHVVGRSYVATELDDPASHLDSLLGDPYADVDAESFRSSRHPDPEMDSIRSLHSRTSHVDSLVTRPLILDQTKRIPPPGPNKLHRRRDQYPHFDNRTVTIPESSSTASHHENSSQQHQAHQQSQYHSQPHPGMTRSKSTRARHATADSQQGQPSHKRAKSYTLSGGPSNWLLSNSLVDVRRSSSLTGERREVRKLQKEHPAGSARPSMALEIGDGDARGASPPAEGGERGSGLGVRRKMGRLRELYRK
ncbi:hypothetical protein KVR01_003421 [Diaporthe batatas]|uniref:uncharacterized protein n=1 Tax=Diaporthe batatas TaxID=748121 RepID=UPI001D040E0D|nr:uncharacterized protein KVR01_003421 [Diaporthe batatas]KAG8167732.1 hypothetical protein KVR01_003421 [Diaporthe batatas]